MLAMRYTAPGTCLRGMSRLWHQQLTDVTRPSLLLGIPLPVLGTEYWREGALSGVVQLFLLTAHHSLQEMPSRFLRPV